MAVSSPVVICLPSGDAAFRAAVESAIEAVHHAAPLSLEVHLRWLYPGVVVRRRDLSGETQPVWYAYRDGTYIAASDPEWHRAPGTAWLRLDPATAEILAVNDETLALFAAKADQLIGRPLFEFTYPENAEMMARQRDVVGSGQVLHSVGRGRTLDGRDVVLEYVCYIVDRAVDCWYRPASVAAGGRAERRDTDRAT
jgi:PAS domain-containing protein